MVLWTKFALVAHLLNSSVVSDTEHVQIKRSHPNGPVKVLSVGSPPFVFQKGSDEYNGIDLHILKTIAKELDLDYTVEQINQSTHHLE